ncbi:MAG: hypothetical protein GF375_00290 [Candidatus Omnitrophica bacterium]|nr:hypothetical protein [Candidatus Omnitrophota bacterium]MBD3268604.1 hypothetical protein [Candidatus Omnitrophota bacterium]
MYKFVVILVFTLQFLGCASMRDYVGVKEGAVGLDLKKGFGEGREKKDYYLTSEGEAITVGDTKNEVISFIGLPDAIDTTLEGYESWIYDSRALKILFYNSKVRDWKRL